MDVKTVTISSLLLQSFWFEPRPHCCEVDTLTTAPMLLPQHWHNTIGQILFQIGEVKEGAAQRNSWKWRRDEIGKLQLAQAKERNTRQKGVERGPERPMLHVGWKKLEKTNIIYPSSHNFSILFFNFKELLLTTIILIILLLFWIIDDFFSRES